MRRTRDRKGTHVCTHTGKTVVLLWCGCLYRFGLTGGLCALLLKPSYAIFETTGLTLPCHSLNTYEILRCDYAAHSQQVLHRSMHGIALAVIMPVTLLRRVQELGATHERASTRGTGSDLKAKIRGARSLKLWRSSAVDPGNSSGPCTSTSVRLRSYDVCANPRAIRLPSHERTGGIANVRAFS